jgi:hypothetical protein
LAGRCITTHRVSAAPVSQVAQAGRGHWQVANDNNNVRNTQGDHIEHTFGPSQQYLAAVRLSRNVLAGLCHTVLPWSAAT